MGTGSVNSQNYTKSYEMKFTYKFSIRQISDAFRCFENDTSRIWYITICKRIYKISHCTYFFMCFRIYIHRIRKSYGIFFINSSYSLFQIWISKYWVLNIFHPVIWIIIEISWLYWFNILNNQTKFLKSIFFHVIE